MVDAQHPDARYVLAPDGVRLATYDVGDPDAPVVLAVHGFASSARGNWFLTGWVRDLTRAGLRVVALDQRGHGASGKPHDPAAYPIERLVDDVRTVADAYLLADVGYLGYSLGARVGWQLARDEPQLVARAVLGGLSGGEPIASFRIDEARANARTGAPVADPTTRSFLAMAERAGHNDLEALIALVEGMRGGPQPDPDDPPRQPLLVATGDRDAVLPVSRRLAEAAPLGALLEIPGRDHFGAPVARAFRDAGVGFLTG